MVPFAGIGPATSPLPRECSTTEPKGLNSKSQKTSKPLTAVRRKINQQSPRTPQNRSFLERETGIEPASLAWKARVLPLNYSRSGAPSGAMPSGLNTLKTLLGIRFRFGGGGWIRTSVGVSQQIYSLPPLATRAPLREEPRTIARFRQAVGALSHRKRLEARTCCQVDPGAERTLTPRPNVTKTRTDVATVGDAHAQPRPPG